MKHLLFAIIASSLIGCQSGKKDQKGNTTDVPPQDKKTNDTTASIPPSDPTDIRSLGAVQLEQSYLETLKALGQPDQKSKAEEWGADGMLHEDWTWKSLGLILNMTSEKGAGAAHPTVFSIIAQSPCALKTKAGIGIGNTYEEVMTAYKEQVNKEESTKEQITIGSVYGGIIFTIVNNKVSQIFLGAAAE